MNNTLAAEIGQPYGAPTKKLLTTGFSSLNYIRHISAAHARLFNRKVIAALGPPKPGLVPALNHRRDDDRLHSSLEHLTPEEFEHIYYDEIFGSLPDTLARKNSDMISATVQLLR